jgi:hypothetical protein
MKSLAGRYEGRWQVREGRDEELTATERKRFLKSGEVIALELRSNGTFLHKGSCEGAFSVSGEIVVFQPTMIDHHTLEDLRAAAEAQDRVFRLDFLFDSFSLVILGLDLATPEDGKLLYLRYGRV